MAFLDKAEQVEQEAKQEREELGNVSYLAQRNNAGENKPPEEVKSEDDKLL